MSKKKLSKMVFLSELHQISTNCEWQRLAQIRQRI